MKSNQKTSRQTESAHRVTSRDLFGVRIGRYLIDAPSPGNVRLVIVGGPRGGESMTCPEEILEKMIRKFYDDNF